MRFLSISEALQTQIFAVVAAILHLGNLQFLEQGEASRIKDDEPLNIAAKLLQYAQRDGGRRALVS
jgi:myosin heavy subunit